MNQPSLYNSLSLGRKILDNFQGDLQATEAFFHEWLETLISRRRNERRKYPLSSINAIRYELACLKWARRIHAQQTA